MRSQTLAWACIWGLLLGFACGGAEALGQATAPATVSPATGAVLHDMAQLAGVIFTGEVVAVRRLDANDGSTGVLEIEFAVEDSIRGVNGGTYKLREWAGLWTAGDEPFRVGRRYLMLLHAPGASGLSSPVGGMDGAIPIRDGTMVDLRWIATRVGQPIAYRAASVARPTALAASTRIDSLVVAATSSTPAAPCSTVLAMLRSWEPDHAAAP